MYVKLFGTILDSSIWTTDPETRVVWITMLAMADADGFVWASVDGLARRANVSLAACERALGLFLAPDNKSRTDPHDGRRIETADGGWFLLNYQKYREIRSRKQVMDAARLARKRKATSRKPATSRHDPAEAEVEAEAENYKIGGLRHRA